MKKIAVICFLFMIASEIMSLLTSTSYGGFLYGIVGVDVESVHAECMKIATSIDMNKCYIDGMRSVTYLTRWPYVISYVTLFALSFYSISSYFMCVIISVCFLLYNIYYFGISSVAAWINFFVLLICCYRARRIMYGTKIT